MFFKSKKEPGNKPAAQVSRKPGEPSIISADLTIVGDLSGEGEVQVDGSIDGDIRIKTLAHQRERHRKGQDQPGGQGLRNRRLERSAEGRHQADRTIQR